MLRAFVPGNPVGKGRPRVTRTGHAYTPAPTRSWEGLAVTIISNKWGGKPPTAAPVRVEVQAMAARPKRLLPKSAGGTWPNSRALEQGLMWRCAKPDADNVAKAVLDALVKAGVLRDDVQVVELVVRSLYAPVDGAPLVFVAVDGVDGGGP